MALRLRRRIAPTACEAVCPLASSSNELSNRVLAVRIADGNEQILRWRNIKPSNQPIGDR
ncbi:MAG: hypothetical protein D6728_15970 [Cyanobacteria bacterium J055]|nr:MAG: hypothetical protein D6728_15970 [Cyanobacteria bacterium J055]